MRHAMRAEYRNEDGDADEIVSWHMVRRGDEGRGMCGRELRPDARGLPESEWGRTAEPFCHTCGALYLREVA
ncbi:hypothetical protein [Streptomyces sp. 7-21]|jgi:hypothetical protein|uniref:hypothetical protein n=1 Tax=Streptomyces sp. 7-21 TaxID=2802283 RepID=UPI00191CDC3E|nr:hypothetical protein [Streptomyces sp. 7-21]MBL1068604.1 hypothetical protein [Streptomyces sp. 7-21]